MISVIIAAADDPKPLARLLAALVPAAADGLVREVAVIGAGGPSRAVAEDAGADLYASFGEALERAKGPWLAGLPLGAIPVGDWMEEVAAHLAREPATPARIVTRPAGRLFGAAPEGWLAPRSLAASAAGAAEQRIQRLARRGGGRRLRILDRR
jgi:hypothetical protein